MFRERGTQPDQPHRVRPRGTARDAIRGECLYFGGDHRLGVRMQTVTEQRPHLRFGHHLTGLDTDVRQAGTQPATEGFAALAVVGRKVLRTAIVHVLRGDRAEIIGVAVATAELC
nr:hypothetical protein [Nocardia sp. CY41]